jgi:hypothetical protein
MNLKYILGATRIMVALVLGLVIWLSFYAMFGMCPEVPAVYYYGGCAVTYSTVLHLGNCKECGGRLPCIAGFDYNKKVKLLSCLCEHKNYDGALIFLHKAENVGIGNIYNASVTGEEVCENLPETGEYL